MVNKFLKLVREKIQKISGSGNKKEVEQKKVVPHVVSDQKKSEDAAPGRKSYYAPKRKNTGYENKRNETAKPHHVVKHKEIKEQDQQKNYPKKTASPYRNNYNKKKPVRQEVKVIEKWDITSFDVPVETGKARFHDFNLSNELMHAIADLNFKYCTPIQKEILGPCLEGKDALGQAQTGTGKTAAFLITIFNKMLANSKSGVRRPGSPRALIIAPTRELVIQIANDARSLSKYTPLKIMEVYGGMDYTKQRNLLKRGVVDALVATPGRLLDFQEKRDLFLGSVETLVIDEADRMLDMGFIPDVRKIVRSTPPKIKRQTLLFSATLTEEVKRLSYQWTNEPVNIEIEPEKTAGESIEQIVYITSNDEKFSLLYNIINQQHLERVIVFANRRDETRMLEEQLAKVKISCKVLSGDVDQRLRLKTLSSFKAGEIKVLVATDVAGRGLHVDSVSHVINYTLPEDPEDYVHRIGRTGRAGASGISISFASEDDSFQLPAIEKFLGHKLKCVYPPDELLLPIQ